MTIRLFSVEPRPPSAIVIAGSGVALAPLHFIIDRYLHAHPNRRVVLEQSIGTSGAIRALKDKAITIGLSLQALSEGENISQFSSTFWRKFIVPLVHKDVNIRAITPGQLSQIFQGDMTTRPNGQRIAPSTPMDDSVTQSLLTAIPNIQHQLHYLVDSRQVPVLYTDQQMRDALLSIKGSVGFLDIGTTHLEHYPCTSGSAITRLSIFDPVPTDAP
ncbi:MAG: substrate-binding domain-containing protein [Myxococcota bacterium]